MKTAIIDIRVPEEMERALILRGFSVLRVPPAKGISTPLASHPDMLMLKIGNTLLSSAAYVEEAPSMFDDLNFNTGMDFSLTSDVFSPEYPRDCIFNALLIGDKLFCKADSISPAVIELAKQYGKKIVNVKQGYPACTVLPLGDSYAVTADPGMAKVLEREGISVSFINNGDISLPPYEYGFIGGTAGSFGGVVYFLGNPERHPDGKKILDTVSQAGLSFVALADTPLFDFGRIIFAE